MSVCLRCGYDLRATPIEAPCPECGLAAHRSVIAHSHPDDSPPQWVAMIAAGSVMLLISYVGFGLLLAFILLDYRFYSHLILGWGWERGLFGAPLATAMFWLSAAMAILHAAANVLLARNDRKHASGGISRIYQWTLRILPLLPIVGLGMLFYDYRLNAGRWWMPPSKDEGLADWLLAAFVLCPPATFLRLRWLALRLSRPRLAEHVTIVAVGCAASLVLAAACLAMFGNGIRNADLNFFGLLVLPASLVALFNLWAMLLLFLVSRKFLQSARESRARWRAADAARAEP